MNDMAITAVYDRAKLDASGAKTDVEVVKEHLRIDGDADDATIGIYIAAAKRQADRFCQNPFVDADGEDEDIPEDVAQWILEAVGRAYELRSSGAQSQSLSGVGSMNWSEIDHGKLFPHRKFVGF